MFIAKQKFLKKYFPKSFKEARKLSEHFLENKQDPKDVEHELFKLLSTIKNELERSRLIEKVKNQLWEEHRYTRFKSVVLATTYVVAVGSINSIISYDILSPLIEESPNRDMLFSDSNPAVISTYIVSTTIGPYLEETFRYQCEKQCKNGALLFSAVISFFEALKIIREVPIRKTITVLKMRTLPTMMHFIEGFIHKILRKHGYSSRTIISVTTVIHVIFNTISLLKRDLSKIDLT